MLLRIRLQRRAKALQVGEAQLLHDRQHLRLVALHLIQPDLVNLRGGLVQRRALPNPERVVSIAIRQRPHARVLSALREYTATFRNFANRWYAGSTSVAIASSSSLVDPLLLRRAYRLRKLLQRLANGLSAGF